MPARADDPRIPVNSAVLGYGPMLPLVVAALGAWFGAGMLPEFALRLAIIWAALVLAFIAGVRRGFGFGVDRASTWSEIASSTTYFALAGLALVAPRADWALMLLIGGYLFAAWADRRAALAGNAPLHFARLRPPQLVLGAAALAALLAWLFSGGTE
ncbi:DUF3429 domain-containing protein [Sphingomonas lenta]|uniref:DUF3429 domain-containing protein n=1 Tax=Sphingomonas lenta TaxID=1141887 RepID=A0A2A2SD46_9SPHN|nr:DUF3429 domain-containing protein [Sphingomonas lenta]PAX07214.1 DUF3429 domain-containing protein [Sphingomonas lenta]